MKTVIALATLILGCLLILASIRNSQVPIPHEWDRRSVEMIKLVPLITPRYIRILGNCTLHKGDRFEFKGELTLAQGSVVLQYANVTGKGGCPDGSRVMFPAEEYYLFSIKRSF